MNGDVVELDFCCPSCNCTQWEADKEAGLYYCVRCGEVVAFDEDDPDYDEEPLNLGACCGCGKTGADVLNIITLQYKAPVAGTGWGCAICELPSDGAIAITCDNCLWRMQSGEDVLKFAVSGYPLEHGRVPIAELVEPFNHKDIPHE